MAKHSKAITRALDKIEDLDLAEIRARTAKGYGWSRDRAEKAEHWYKNFLKLCYLNRRKPVAALGEDSDLLWHEHILYTDQYRRDCKALFGHYLDHDPIEGRASAAELRAFERSRQQYLKEFGALPEVMAFRCLKIPPKPPPPPPPHKRK